MNLDPALLALIESWQVEPAGPPMRTRTSVLLPVTRQDEPLMVKVALEPEEVRGSALLAWWRGRGAARVFEQRGDAVLMERATGGSSLAEMAGSGGDDEVTTILCQVTTTLHAAGDRNLPDLVPLSQWFHALLRPALPLGGVLDQARQVAMGLLASEVERVPLHGDIHHGNVLDFGSRGWLAIDPKGLMGERTFDFANLLRNPDEETAVQPARFQRQLDVIGDQAGLPRLRLLQWTLAFAGLSACWLLESDTSPDFDLAIARLATGLLASEVE